MQQHKAKLNPACPTVAYEFSKGPYVFFKETNIFFLSNLNAAIPVQ